MDTFSPITVPTVSKRLRRLILASSGVMVLLACSISATNAAPESFPAGSEPMGAFATAKPQVSAAATATPPQSTPDTTPQQDESDTPVPQFSSEAAAPVTPAPVTTPGGFGNPLGSTANSLNPTGAPQDTVAEAAKPASVTWSPSATGKIVVTGLNPNGGLTLAVNRTGEIKTSTPVKRVSVGQPEVADIQAFADNLLLVTAKKAGSTQVIVWDDKDQSQSIDVNVEIPLDQLKDLIGKLAPGSNIEISVANDTIVLRGQAPNLTVAKQIGDVAAAYGKTQNFIEVAGGQTVAVQVQFAEVSRSVTNSLGVNWGFSDGTSIFGSVPGGSGPLTLHADDNGFINALGVSDQATPFDIFGVGKIGKNPFAYFIKALRENNLLRVLQEPNLTTTSGQPASFLAGGQVAVPVPTENGTVGIEYKEFGVRLLLTPIVLGNGKIRLIMEAESSDLDYTAGTTIQSARVPGLRTRRVQSTVELPEGSTMSVAGLLDDSVIATRSSIPGLGDLPVLGQLFRSTRYQRKETELVILITPKLAAAMNPDQVTALPGANWRHPNELEQAFLGDLGGNPEADATREFYKRNKDRGLTPADRAPKTDGNPLAANPANGPEVAAARKVEAPMFVGEHGFKPVREPAPATVTSTESGASPD